MTTVFIAGSINIKSLNRLVKDRLDRILESGFRIVVGDANGVDVSVQRYLAEKRGLQTVVFCSGQAPRNNIGGWAVETVAARATPGTRAFFAAKDLEMARVADYGLMIWDARSTGTLSNVLELLRQKKKTVVFVDNAHRFMNVGDIEQFEALLQCMTSSARAKAEQKIGLSPKIDALRRFPNDLFVH